MFIIDPPSGWLYGFPKPIPFAVLNGASSDLETWLIEHFYPKSEIDKNGGIENLQYRYWEDKP